MNKNSFRRLIGLALVAFGLMAPALSQARNFLDIRLPAPPVPNVVIEAPAPPVPRVYVDNEPPRYRPHYRDDYRYAPPPPPPRYYRDDWEGRYHHHHHHHHRHYRDWD